MENKHLTSTELVASCFFHPQISVKRTNTSLSVKKKMASICMNEFYRILGETLQPLDVENLKFVLAGSFTGKFH